MEPGSPDPAEVDDQFDAVFHALADRHRRLILDRLRERDGQTLTELCERMAMTRQAVSKHVAVLATADLISTRRRGREKLHHLNPVPLHEIHRRWISRYDVGRLDAPAALKTRLESQHDD
jgi:DNA-binding transcriptional ArsR family regulator